MSNEKFFIRATPFIWALMAAFQAAFMTAEGINPLSMGVAVFFALGTIIVAIYVANDQDRS